MLIREYKIDSDNVVELREVKKYSVYHNGYELKWDNYTGCTIINCCCKFKNGITAYRGGHKYDFGPNVVLIIREFRKGDNTINVINLYDYSTYIIPNSPEATRDMLVGILE